MPEFKPQTCRIVPTLLLIQDLVEDWSSKSPPDLLYFVPYVWKFKLQFKQFELLTPTNEFNWIDTSSARDAI